MRTRLVVDDPVRGIVYPNPVDDSRLHHAVHEPAEREFRMTLSGQQPAAPGVVPHAPQRGVHARENPFHRFAGRNSEFA